MAQYHWLVLDGLKTCISFLYVFRQHLPNAIIDFGAVKYLQFLGLRYFQFLAKQAQSKFLLEPSYFTVFSTFSTLIGFGLQAIVRSFPPFPK